MTQKKLPTCGIIMPISDMDGCPAAHWAEVKEIFEIAISDAGLTPRLVSDAPETGVIQTRIIGNIYEDEMMLCDVSGRNPNVMFELGLRIAFDKKVVIAKDDLTTYPFDTSPIEYVPYPRALRYSQVIEFKDKLASKLKATHEAEAGRTSFLKGLGPIRIAELETTKVPGVELLIDEIRSLRSTVQSASSAPHRVKIGNIFASEGTGSDYTTRFVRTPTMSRSMVGACDKILAQRGVEVSYIKTPEGFEFKLRGPQHEVDYAASLVMAMSAEDNNRPAG